MDSAFYKINNYSKTENDSLNVVKNSCEKNSSLFQSVHTYEETDDSWKPSALGIKCYSVKHDGYVFLTRKILDLSSTDGKRKIDVCYNYAKDYKNGHKIKPRGSNLQNCSFCDTVSLDFDPDSTLFDLVMEVQIITLAPTRKPIENGLNRNIEQKGNKDNPESPVPFTDTGQSLDESSDPEETNITSVYDLRILGRRDSEPNSAFFSPDFELSKRLSEEDTKILEGDGQKIIIKTVIKSENDNDNGSNNSINNLYRFIPINEKLTNKRSNSTSSLFSSISENNSLTKGYWSPRKYLSPNKQSSPCESRSSSKRSIYTTVEFFPPCENYVEMVDLSDEQINEEEKFFNDLEMIEKVEEQIRGKIKNNENEKENDIENMQKVLKTKKNIETNDFQLKILKENNRNDFSQDKSNKIKLKNNEKSNENFINKRQKSEEKEEIIKKDKQMIKKKKSQLNLEKENVTNSEFLSDSQESLVNTNQGKNFPTKSEIQTCEDIEQEKSLAKKHITENEKESHIVEKQIISNIEAEYKNEQKILETEKADNFSESFSTNLDETESVDKKEKLKGSSQKLIYEKKIVFSSSQLQKIDFSSNIDFTEKIEKNHLNSFQVLKNENFDLIIKDNLNEEEKELELNSINININSRKRKFNRDKNVIPIFDPYNNSDNCYTSTTSNILAADFTDPTKGETSFEEYQATNDPFELTVTKEGTKPSENIVNSLFSRLFKTDTAFSNDKESLENFTPKSVTDQLSNDQSQNIVDINIIDRKKYKLNLDDNFQNISYSDILISSEDSCYFPNYKINKDYVETIDITGESLNQNKCTNNNDNAIFDPYNNSDNCYTSTTSNILAADFTDPTKGETSFEEYQATNDPFELTVTKEGTKPSENIVNSLFSRLFKTDTAFSNDKESLENFTPKSVTDQLSNNENKIIKIFNSKEKSSTDSKLYFFSSPVIKKTSKSIPDYLESIDQFNQFSLDEQNEFFNNLDYSYLAHKFNVKDFSEINTLFQDSFFRASLSINKAKRIMLNEILPILSPNDVPSLDLIDIANVQNLKFNKPFFDDFANFYQDEIQFSNYQLLVNSKRFDFLNNLERNGTPFFYIQDNHRFFNDLEKTFSLKNFVGFLIICSGAFTLYTTTLE